jgi:hypothetical protein
MKREEAKRERLPSRKQTVLRREKTVQGIDIAKRAKEQVAQVTGLQPETVSGLTRDGEGWHVSVDMIELKRIPEVTDVMATYEVILDDQGNLLRYQRMQRYYRGQAAENNTP